MSSRMIRNAGLGIAVFLLFPASPRAGGPADVEALMGWMNGQLSTAAQVAEEPGARLRHVYVTRVELPHIPGETLYLEWHAGAPDGPIDQQRIWSYEAKGDHIAMRFYTFYEKADAALTGILDPEDVDADAVAALTLDDFHGYPDECTFILRRNGEVIEGRCGTGNCRIFNREMGVWMRPDMILRFEPGRLWEAGEYVYESKGGEPPAETRRFKQDFRRVE